MSAYTDSIFESQPDVRLLVIGSDGSAWLPGSQRDAVSVSRTSSISISLLHRDGRDVAVTAQGLSGIVPDNEGKNLEAIFFQGSQSGGGASVALEQVLEENAKLREKLSDFEEILMDHGVRLKVLEAPVPPEVEAPEPPRRQTPKPPKEQPPEPPKEQTPEPPKEQTPEPPKA